MTEIELTKNDLIVRMQGIDKILAIKNQVQVPLKHIVGVWMGIDEETQAEFKHSIRLPGSYMPGIVIAGTFVVKGKKMFWNVHHDKNKVITIKVADDKYIKLVLQVEDPAASVAAIQQALQTHLV